jgi:hypothetical protein
MDEVKQTTPSEATPSDALAYLRIWRREKTMPFKSMVGCALTEEYVLGEVDRALSGFIEQSAPK